MSISYYGINSENIKKTVVFNCFSFFSTNNRNGLKTTKSLKFSRYSLFESKRVFWQFEVEGAADSKKMFEKVVNATVDKYLEYSDNIQSVVRKVSHFLSGLRFDKHNYPKTFYFSTRPVDSHQISPC